MQRTEMSGDRVVVGLSGGVDSAVAALLLKRAGHDVVGLFMKNWEDDDDDAYCSTRQDWLDAAAVADVIGIDLEAVNFAAEYKDRVFAAFLREYAAGRTPNPDVLCNAEIKFSAFLDHALELGASHIATGHYARVRTVDGGVQLLRGLDPAKDQSYFLHRLTQAQLARTLFPVGHLPKREVRAIAHAAGLPNAAKRDSTGICFIGERPFRAFLNRYLPMTPGPIRTPLDADGADAMNDASDAGDADAVGRLGDPDAVRSRVIGEHVGLAFYTLGQRKGIGIGGQRGGSGDPWFVARKDIASNTLWVVPGHDHPWLMTRRVIVQDLAWIDAVGPRHGARVTAKTRYRHDDAPCRVRPGEAVSAGGGSGNGVRSGASAEDAIALAFDTPQWAVTPGQSAVLYDGERCLGGGVIGLAGARKREPVDSRLVLPV
jgi:tRNA-specific 2-thiouridylase